ncbi:MAG: thiamine biosynthesis protein [Pseudonocardiales bacterium]|nr:thiamine biosynthesis protein [Pseudonocardiales bacterium]
MTAAATPSRRVVKCMGTVFSFDVHSPGVEQTALDEAERWLHWVDRTFSTYRADSDISRLGRGEYTLADCAPEVTEIIETCNRLTEQTQGYFSAYASGVLDPSGLVKGWAIETASDILVAAGSVNHCVNGGGDVQCAGDASPDQPWRIGVSHPLEPGMLAAVVIGTGLAVATSGTAERGAHVINPHTRQPPSELASITLVGTRLGRTDAYATAGFAMGAAAREWIEGLPDHEAFAVCADGTAWSTSGWSAAGQRQRPEVSMRSRCSTPSSP